jgi:membrane-associated phospholipid phosphatase
MKEKLLGFIRWVRNFIREKFHYQSDDLPYYITICIALVLLGVTTKGFIEITEGLTENKLNPFDTGVSNFVLNFRSKGLTDFFRFVTDLGDRNTYIVITIALALFFWLRYKKWKFSLQIVSVLLLSAVSNVGLKQVINRARPSLDHLVQVNTLSFPSGHSMSAMAYYGFLIYLTTRFQIHIVARILLVTILAVLILAIGTSRIYLGVHYPSDVASGYLGGLIWVAFSAVVFNIIDLLRKRKRKDQKQHSRHRL